MKIVKLALILSFVAVVACVAAQFVSTAAAVTASVPSSIGR